MLQYKPFPEKDRSNIELIYNLVADESAENNMVVMFVKANDIHSLQMGQEAI